MEQMYIWVKSVIFGLCLMELFSHLVRKEEYRRYIRFFGGMILLLMMISPVFEFFSGKNIFDEALQRAVVREEAVNLELARETLSELQNKKISEAYCQELERQMKEIAAGHHQRVISIQVELQKEKGEPTAVDSVDMVVASVRKNLNVFETEKEENAGQKKAIEEIRSEIASIYGVEKKQITISIKEQ